MARRFSQIKRGAEYDQALDNYVAYIRNAETRPTKRMQGGVRGNRRETVPASVKPFGRELGTGEYALTRVSSESVNQIGTALSTRLFTTGANLTGGIRLPKFRPAKVSAFRGPGAAAYVQSQITRLYYLKYEGDNYGAPFGATSETEEEFDGGSAVKAAILTLFAASDIKRVSISPEKVPV